MYLKCDCGKLIDMDKEFIRNVAAEKKRNKVILCATTLMTTVICKCKKVYIIEIGAAVYKKFKLRKGPMKGKTIEIPRKG